MIHDHVCPTGGDVAAACDCRRNTDGFIRYRPTITRTLFNSLATISVIGSIFLRIYFLLIIHVHAREEEASRDGTRTVDFLCIRSRCHRSFPGSAFVFCAMNNVLICIRYMYLGMRRGQRSETAKINSTERGRNVSEFRVSVVRRVPTPSMVDASFGL